GRDQSLVDLDPAIAAPALVAFAAKSRDPLAHADLAADDPVDRTAREHLRRPPRIVSRRNPAAAALCLPCGSDAAQVVEAVDPDGELQEVQRHNSGTPLSLAAGFWVRRGLSAPPPPRRDRRGRTAPPQRRRRPVPPRCAPSSSPR